MQIKQLFTKSKLRNFSYLIELNENEWLCIDPFDAEQIIESLNGQKLKAIINTHEHYDHVYGNKDLQKLTDCEIWAHYKAKELIPGVSRCLLAGEQIKSSDSNSYLEVLDTPGHTFSHLCLVHYENKIPTAIFSGDTLFNASVGNCKNGGDVDVLYKTITEQFLPFNENILLYPGHEYLENNLNFSLNLDPDNELSQNLLNKHLEGERLVTNMGQEKKINPFFRLSEFKNHPLVGQNSDSDHEVFITLRKLRDNW